jgi:hypothetical protein
MSENSFAFNSLWTKYNGITYRSRSEARWAVFFDTMHIDAAYEPEGFHLPSGVCYLPDFYLPQYDAFVEIKGILESDNKQKGLELSEATGKPVIFGQANMEYEIHTPDGAEPVKLFDLPTADEARRKARNWKFEFIKGQENQKPSSGRKSRSAASSKHNRKKKNAEIEVDVTAEVFSKYGIEDNEQAERYIFNYMLLVIGDRILERLIDCTYDDDNVVFLIDLLSDGFKVMKSEDSSVIWLNSEIVGESLNKLGMFLDPLCFNHLQVVDKNQSKYLVGTDRLEALNLNTVPHYLTAHSQWWWRVSTDKSHVMDAISANIQPLRQAFLRITKSNTAGNEKWRKYSAQSFRQDYIRKMHKYRQYLDAIRHKKGWLWNLLDRLDNYMPGYSRYCYRIIDRIFAASALRTNLQESSDSTPAYRKEALGIELRKRYKKLKVPSYTEEGIICSTKTK